MRFTTGSGSTSHSVHSAARPLHLIVKHLAVDEIFDGILRRIHTNLRPLEDSVSCKLAELLKTYQHQHPITYNHYYTDNVQKARQEASHDLINKIVMDTTGGDLNGAIDTKKNGVDTKKNGIDLGRLFNALQKHVTVDMHEQACSEVRVGLDAYYKVCW